MQHHFPSPYPRGVQHIVQQAYQVVGQLVSGIYEALLLAGEFGVPQQLENARERAERGADLMAH